MQLVGMMRPIVVTIFLVVVLFTDRITHRVWIIAGLGLLALMTIAQVILRRQRTPVWTKKAIALVSTTFIITAIAALLSARLALITLPLLILLQPLALAGAWFAWQPIDATLKRKAQDRALKLRAQHPDILCIGITGSMGKTTTKELLAHFLQPLGAIATPTYVNSEMGVAQWLIKELSISSKLKAQSSKLLIVEMGAYRTGEIKRLCDIAQPQIGIITAIGMQHMGLFGSAEAIQDAKAELLEALPSSGHAFINAESEGARAIAGRARCPVTTVGLSTDATLHAEDVRESDGGLHCRIGNEQFHIPLYGRHNITNVLLAIAVARHLKMPDADIRARFGSFRPLAHTFAMKEEHGVTILDDTHNSSPESFRAGLAWAKGRPERPRGLLMSGIIELGQDEERILKELGEDARSTIDRVIFTGKRGMQAFVSVFGKDAELFSKSTAPIAPGSLLLCIGRMPLSAIQRLLPPLPSPPGLRTKDRGEKKNSLFLSPKS